MSGPRALRRAALCVQPRTAGLRDTTAGATAAAEEEDEGGGGAGW